MHSIPGFAMPMRFLLTGSLLAAAILPAAAADYSRFDYQPSYALRPAVHDWSGGYAGIHAGWSWGDYGHRPAPGGQPRTTFNADGAAVGLQVGYGVQLDTLYLGIEADASFPGMSGTGRHLGTPFKLGNDLTTSFRGRIGYAMDNVLLYGTGGVAVARMKASLAELSQRQNHLGWTIGAGAEFGEDRWSLRAEYLYQDFVRKSYSTIGLGNIDHSAHIVRAGLNYRFGE
jgi:outer membrane immunogenic protein